MTGVLYAFLGVVFLGLLSICAYFLLRKGRETDRPVEPVN